MTLVNAILVTTVNVFPVFFIGSTKHERIRQRGLRTGAHAEHRDGEFDVTER